MCGVQDKACRVRTGLPWILARILQPAITGVVVCLTIWGPGIGVAMADEREAILATVRSYTTAVYARDYAAAYRWLSRADRQLKSLVDYEQDNEPFRGPSLVLARRLAQEVVLRDGMVDHAGERTTVRATLTLPNANAEEVSSLLLAQRGFSEVPPEELGERMAKLEALIANGHLPQVGVEETWTLVRDPEGWRVFLDWGSGTRIQFATQVPRGLNVIAAFDRTEVLIPRGEAVQLRLTVRNIGTDPVRLTVSHRVEPSALEEQLDLVQCGYLFPRDLAEGGVDESAVVYFVDGDLPKDVAQLWVTLTFQRVK